MFIFASRGPCMGNGAAGRVSQRAGVEFVQPAQGVGRTVAGPCPLGIARFLRRAVGKMEADLVGPRHLLKSADAGPPQAFIVLERLGRIVGAAGDEARGKGGAILDALRGALSHERIHRMAGVAEQRRAADGPPWQRLAIEQRPDETRLGGADDAPNLWVPPLERGERASDGGAIGPVLPVPGVVLRPTDEVQQARARDEVVHEMPARADPRLRSDLGPEVGDALDRYQAAIGDAAGEARRLLTEERGAHGRMDAVGADQDVDGNSGVVLEPGLDAVALVGEADDAVPQMDASGRKPRGDDREQVGPVNREMRRTVELFTARVERRSLERPAILPAPLVGADRPHGLEVELLAEAEPVEDAHRVRRHVDAAADLGQLRSLLVDIDLEAGVTERDGG